MAQQDSATQVTQAVQALEQFKAALASWQATGEPSARERVKRLQSPARQAVNMAGVARLVDLKPAYGPSGPRDLDPMANVFLDVPDKQGNLMAQHAMEMVDEALVALQSRGRRDKTAEIQREHDKGTATPPAAGPIYNITISDSNIGGLGVGPGANVTGGVNVSATPWGAFTTSHRMGTVSDVASDAKATRPPLVVLGPHVIAEGERVAASGNTWTVRLYRFLLGDTSALSHFADARGNVLASDRCIVLSDPGEARALTGDFSWRAEKNYIEVQVPVAPAAPRRSVLEVEDLDIDTMEEVRGVAAGRSILQALLGTAVGLLDSGVGCWIPEWLQASELAPRLADLVRMDILRLSSVPRIETSRAEVDVPLDFIERVLSVEIRPDKAETGDALADIEVSFVGGGNWKGEILIATKRPEPIDMEHDFGLRELALLPYLEAAAKKSAIHKPNVHGAIAPVPPAHPTISTVTAPQSVTLASVYLSYGDDDLPSARRLFEALEVASVPVFFRAEHAALGSKHHRSARKNIREYEHVILLCSERSLSALSVMSELDEMLSREFDDGASERIIPVLLDDFASQGWQPRHPDIRRAVLDRVPLEMKGADGDRAKFEKAMKRLLGALKG